jgi:hypothetical protein
MNKYKDESSSSSSSSDDDDDIDIHSITQIGTFNELKIAIAKDRPRLVNLKDRV